MKYVYAFKEGKKEDKNLLGGKGANLAEMINLGLPVPNGFTVTTEACIKYYDEKEVISNDVIKEIVEKLHELEQATNKKFGSNENPLLVSVRSGARVSMPGMLDTILNLGMNDEVAEGFTKKTNNKRFVYDSYRRFIGMFSDVVKGYDKKIFEGIISDTKKEKNIEHDIDLTEDDMYNITQKYKEAYLKISGKPFPQNPYEQLVDAVTAVFRSWNNDRAIFYRKMNDIPKDWGTAVNVQEMVYGNSGNTSGTGVAFTRNPSTGEKKLYGEYLINAQGEDVVAGIRTPQPIDTLNDLMPNVYDEFVKVCEILENHYKDMQDMEFTIEDGKLYMLQTRNGKRTGNAAIKIAVDLVNEKMLTKEEAIMKVEPKILETLLHNNFDEEDLKNHEIIGKGLPASPGAATGMICFNAEDAIKYKEEGKKNLILVRLETSPEDIEGMHVSNGILTIRGGMTSHAAVVARGMGTCCVSGCNDVIIDEINKTLKTKEGLELKEFDYISIDGTTGYVYKGEVKTKEPEMTEDFKTFMNWVDNTRKLKVRVNADTEADALTAIKFGAEGIGLCRTEHMFFKEERIKAVREMIIADNETDRIKALDKILPMQQEDFEKLFRVMKDLPVTIRYLDPPLHEFLPKEEDEIIILAQDLNTTVEKVKERISSLHEFNPMMGHRGCRLSVTYNEIAVMQTKAVINAALKVNKEGLDVKPEIMIPLVGDVEELKYIKNIVVNTIKEVDKEEKVKYTIGTMIEVPRAAILSHEIAKEADFFSFGTNDLTQMTYGFSRDDASKFLNDYYDKKIFESDPFNKLDTKGVGKLIEISKELGRKTKKNLKLGICGEHGGEPSSVEFCHNIGLDYVSCSPYRIPIAKLAAAQAKIKDK